jgi:pre-mRNA-splicing helicase BRR2
MHLQAMWEPDSPLKQIPHFETDIVKRCKEASVDNVYNIMDMEDSRRNTLLQLDERQMYTFMFI